MRDAKGQAFTNGEPYVEWVKPDKALASGGGLQHGPIFFTPPPGESSRLCISHASG